MFIKSALVDILLIMFQAFSGIPMPTSTTLHFIFEIISKSKIYKKIESGN